MNFRSMLIPLGSMLATGILLAACSDDGDAAPVAAQTSSAGTQAIEAKPANVEDETAVIAWTTDYDAALARAEREDRLVVVDFYATWCGPCKMMDQRTFTDPRVRERMGSFVSLKIDVDQQRDIAQRYGIESLPTLAVLDASGKPVVAGVGFHDTDRFLQMLDQADGRATKVSRP